MKLIIETDDGSNVAHHIKVSKKGMDVLLDLFAWIDMLDTRGRTMRAPDTTVGDSSPVSEHSTNNQKPPRRIANEKIDRR